VAGRSSVRALHLAHLVDGELKPCGSVGSRITEVSGQAIRAALHSGAPVVVEVEFRGWTPAGEVRHAVVKGWHGG
jgi:bifunctional non-homologous end joining protein LigD